MPRAVFISQDVYLAQVKAKREQCVPMCAGWNRVNFELCQVASGMSCTDALSSKSTSQGDPESRASFASVGSLADSVQDFGVSDETQMIVPRGFSKEPLQSHTAVWIKRQRNQQGRISLEDDLSSKSTSQGDRESFGSLSDSGQDVGITHDARIGVPPKTSDEHACSQKVTVTKGSRSYPLMMKEIYYVGESCTVRKHQFLGCAVVSFSSDAIQAAVMEHVSQHQHEVEGQPMFKLGSKNTQVRTHLDKASGLPDSSSVFVSWGRQAEKAAQFPITSIAAAFDLIVTEHVLMHF
eukprot:TRINITY_DN12084_c0_g2_i1.p1 TRINITY_DN12084_c0_g2~~TRINITY_DN12084_c0_g2_i1.p1  ORF type:complete len:314 (-),score=38.73 TRINITY_DN12084_c0_g2_i1:651-1532(-)